MDIHATHHNLFSWSAGMKGGLSEAFFFFWLVAMSMMSCEVWNISQCLVV